MILDLFLLTGLLCVTGGPANPFAIFYLVNVVLAAVLLRPLWGWVLGILASASYALLYLGHVPLPALEPAGHGLPLDPASIEAAWRLHLQGTIVAFATATVIVLYFIARETAEVERLEGELILARQRQARGQQLEAMVTLAAGAAHELASPLSTIAVVAKELERELGRPGDLALAAEDARLIRSEVERCRRILDQMSADAGESAGEPLEEITPAELAAAILDGLQEPGRVDVQVTEPSGRLVQPRRALARAARGLVKNALDASGAGQPVRLVVRIDGDRLRIEVVDEGHGMDRATLERAGHPFFTTKEPGAGMGLGLFLARTLVEGLGGQLEIESAPERGTRVVVWLPKVQPLGPGA